MFSNTKKTASTIVLLLILSLTLLPVTVPYVIAAEGSWTIKTPMQQARGRLGVAVVNGKIYAIGGALSAGGAVLSTVEEYDTGFVPALIASVNPTGKLPMLWGEIKRGR